MFSAYENFEITVGPRGSEGYLLLAHGPGGDARGNLRLPTDEADYQSLLSRLYTLDTDETALTALGHILFERLFPETIRHAYIRSQSVLPLDCGLRLRLHIATSEAEVASLPWEFLTDPDHGPLALLDTPLVRYLPQPAVIPTLSVALPLKVLLTAAQAAPSADIEHELCAVQESLANLGDLVQITVEPHLTPGKLQRLLRMGFHVWHFVGHSGFNRDGTAGHIAFEDATGSVERVGAPQLGILLHRSSIRLVVLDAGASGKLAVNPLRSIAPALVQACVPAVVAMQFTVPEETTRAFATEFYKTLAEGFPIDACVTEGRKAVMNTCGLDRPDWGIPVVYSRAPDGILFKQPEPQPSPHSAPIVSIPRQLRAPVADFVGRASEIDRLVQAIRCVAEHGTATALGGIRGMGGVGKTQVAYIVAQQLESCFPDGQILIELHGVSNSSIAPEQALQTIIRAFDREARLSNDLEELQATYRTLLNGKRILILADNARDVQQVRPLAPPAGCALLITSRSRFKLDGMTTIDLETLSQTDAEQLLLNICPRIGGAAPALVALCDRLPLALRISASILINDETLRVARYLERLSDERTRLRHLCDRDDSMCDVEASLRLSYQALDSVAQMALCRLSAFPASFDLSAAAVIIHLPTADQESTEDMLSTLYRRSLLNYHAASERYELHDLVRLFAVAQVDAAERQHTWQRYIDYYMALAEQAEPMLVGSQQKLWLSRLEADHDHLRAVLQWSLDQQDMAAAVRLGGTLWHFWERQGHLHEGRMWLEKALMIAEHCEEESSRSQYLTPKELRAKALNGAGALALKQGSYWLAHTLYTECLVLRRALDDRHGVAVALNNLGLVAFYQGNYEPANSYFQTCLVSFEELGDQGGIASTLGNLGLLAQDQGQYPLAVTYIGRCVALFRDLRDPYSIALNLDNLGNVMRYQGNYAQARQLQEESLDIRRELGDAWGIASVLDNLGWIALDQGNVLCGQEHFTESLVLFHELGDQEGVAWGVQGLADVAYRLQQPQRAARLWGAAEALRTSIGAPLPPSEQAYYEDTIKAARPKLDHMLWTAAWTAGQALSLDQAVAEAIADNRRLAPSHD
jgi:predicted ATPase